MEILFFFLVLLCNNVNGAVITTPPVDTIGYTCGVSTFYCGSNRSDVTSQQWQIGHHAITEEDIVERGLTVNGSVLTITGLPINDGVDIGCIVVVSSPYAAQSSSATFTVSSAPPPPVNVNFVFLNDTNMRVYWESPLCLPDNYTYFIEVHDSVDSSVRTFNTTELEYIVDVIPCNITYTINVSVIDGSTGMRSNPSSIQVTTIMQDQSINFFDPAQVQFEEDQQTCCVHVQYQVNASSHHVCPTPVHGSITQIGTDVDFTNVFGKPAVDNLNGYLSFRPINSGLSELLIQLLANGANKFVKTLSTFHVQRLEVDDLHNGSVKLQCIFASESLASGCWVVLNSSLSYNITREGTADSAEMIVDVPEGVYEISVHDINNYDDVSEVESLSEIHTFTLPLLDLTTISSSTIAEILPTASSTQIDSNSVSLSPSISVGGGSGIKSDWYIISGFIISAVILSVLLMLVIASVIIVFKVKKFRAYSSSLLRKERILVSKESARPHQYEPAPVLIPATTSQLRQDKNDDCYEDRNYFIGGQPVHTISKRTHYINSIKTPPHQMSSEDLPNHSTTIVCTSFSRRHSLTDEDSGCSPNSVVHVDHAVEETLNRDSVLLPQSKDDEFVQYTVPSIDGRDHGLYNSELLIPGEDDVHSQKVNPLVSSGYITFTSNMESNLAVDEKSVTNPSKPSEDNIIPSREVIKDQGTASHDTKLDERYSELDWNRPTGQPKPTIPTNLTVYSEIKTQPKDKFDDVNLPYLSEAVAEKDKSYECTESTDSVSDSTERESFVGTQLSRTISDNASNTRDVAEASDTLLNQALNPPTQDVYSNVVVKKFHESAL